MNPADTAADLNEPRMIPVQQHTFGTPTALDNVRHEAMIAHERAKDAALGRRSKKRRAANKRARAARKANR